MLDPFEAAKLTMLVEFYSPLLHRLCVNQMGELLFLLPVVTVGEHGPVVQMLPVMAAAVMRKVEALLYLGAEDFAFDAEIAEARRFADFLRAKIDAQELFEAELMKGALPPSGQQGAGN